MEDSSSKDKSKAESKPAKPSASLLAPSQALKRKGSSAGNKKDGSSSNETCAKNNDNNNNNNTTKTNTRNNNNRRRRNGNNNKNKNKPAAEGTNDVEMKPNPDSTANENSIDDNADKSKTSNKGKKQRQRTRGKKKGGDNSNATNEEKGNGSDDANGKANNTEGDTKGQQQQASNNGKKRNNNKKRKPKKKFPWRRHIPEGTVDPITLEDLNTLEYPPFALCADEPYVPVTEWPVPEEASADSKEISNPDNVVVVVEDLNRQRLADQWGEHMLPSEKSKTANTKKPPPKVPPLWKRPLNLFDGRALAFYMVSQLQFIDPFTRRDLTRPELLNLDKYLERHGSGMENNTNKNRRKKQQQKLNVTDAYDAKGITLSSAGAAAATAQGRADIMQQMAQQLLNSLFVGQSSVSATPQAEPTNSLQEQYAALQRQERAAAAQGEQRYERGGFAGTYDAVDFGHNEEINNNSGFLIIDDDENPELRGRGHNDFPSLGAPTASTGPRAGAPSANGSTFYSASHISGRYATSTPATGTGAFPALPTPASSTDVAKSSNPSSETAKPPAKAKKSKTLSKISGIVKKTTAEEKQRQWEAREAARRKAMMSNLTYGMNPVGSIDPSQSLPAIPTAAGAAGTSVSDEQIQRNRAFAEALGVKPATQRHYASGWARPTSNDHLDELDAALYPDELILHARDHKMQLLLKLEKRWKQFLSDDKAASLPLNRMDKPSRKFVHHYAEFWKLKTESFDPEPNRYIHCVKLLDTRMPQPLLSQVVRNWKGPSALPLPDATRTLASVMNDHTTQQTAGQTSRSDGLLLKPPPTNRVQQPLRAATAMSSSKGDLVAFGEAAVQNSRSNALMEKERPQLNLLPRSVPLELPPFQEQLEQQHQDAFDLNEDIKKRQARLEEKRQRERELEQKQKQALEDAFASDDEEDIKVGDAFGSDSEWDEEQEPVYNGNDEE